MSDPLLHVTSAGPDDAPVVVLLHSIATSAAMWEAQIADLATTCHVLAIDLPGHGMSAPLAGEPTIADYAEAVMATLDALGVDTAALVGLSFGSMIAQHIGACYPHRVSALVLSNGVAWAAPAVGTLWKERIAEAEREGMGSQVEPTLERWFTAAFRSDHAREVDRIRKLVASTSLQGYCQAAKAIASLDNRRLLPQITAPVLVIAGEADAAAPAAVIAAMAGAIPGSTLQILPGAHLLNVELAREYSHTLIEFFRSNGHCAQQGIDGGLR